MINNIQGGVKMSVKRTLDKAIKTCDEELFYQLRFGSGRIEGIKGELDFAKQYAKDLKKEI